MNSASPAQILAFAKAVSDSQRGRESQDVQDGDAKFSQELKRSMDAGKSEKPAFENRVDPKPVDKSQPVDNPETKNNENAVDAPSQPAPQNTQNATDNPDAAAQLAAAQLVSQAVAVIVEAPVALPDVDVTTLQISTKGPAFDPLAQLLKTNMPLIAPLADGAESDAAELQLPNNAVLDDLFAALPVTDNAAHDPKATAQTVLDLLAADGKPVDRSLASTNKSNSVDLGLFAVDSEAEAVQLPATPGPKAQNQHIDVQGATKSAPVQSAEPARLPSEDGEHGQSNEHREKSDVPAPITDRQSPVSLTLSPSAASNDLNVGASIQQAAANTNLNDARTDKSAIAAVTTVAANADAPIAAPAAPQAAQSQFRLEAASLTQANAAAQADPGNAVEKAVANQVSRGLMHVNEAGQRVLTIRLTPPELGTVRVDVIERSGAITAHLHAEDDGVRVALERFLPQIRQDLRANDAPIRDIVLANPYNNNANNPNRGFFGQNKQRAPADGPVFAIDGVRDIPAILAARELGGHADANGVNALV
jgi:flagellar hook-length control protein FliK